MPRARGGRIAELTEMHESVTSGRALFHDGAWGLATLEVCFAILESARGGTEIQMRIEPRIRDCRRPPPDVEPEST